jgi:hypothetical protein
VGTQAQEPAQDICDVAAEDPAIRVQFVDDDDPELLEQLEPLRVVRQDRRMEHVRVGHDHLAGTSDRGPDGRRRIPVVGRGGHRQAGRSGKLGELGDLILTEGLRGEDVQRPGGRIVGDRLQGGDRVAQGLARGSRGDDDDIAAGPDRLEGLGLVNVQAFDAAGRKAVADPFVEPVGQGSVRARPRRQGGVMDDAPGEGWFGKEVPQDRRRIARGVCAHGYLGRSIQNTRSVRDSVTSMSSPSDSYVGTGPSRLTR